MNYYDEHADRYIKDTLGVDMSEQYALFLPYLEQGARILDAGCGSGRDSKAFLALGYRVDAFDASGEMVQAARDLTGLAVRQLRFEELDCHRCYDGIWASASLLHVPRLHMDAVFLRLHRALTEGGILYASFKEREADFESEGRIFTCYTVEGLLSFLGDIGLFSLLDLQQSRDLRAGREGERWLNVVLRRV